MAQVPKLSAKARPILEKWGAPIVAVLAGAVFVALVAPQVLPYGRTHDFLALYTGGVLARTNPSQMFSIAIQEKIQLEVAPESPVFAPFIRPAFSSLFYVPFTWMPLRMAFVLWVVLGVAALVSVWVWATRRFGPEALVYCAFFVPPIYGILNGQDTAFLLGLTVVAYSAAVRGAKILCGILFGVLLCKFHLFLLVPVALAMRREWRILAGFVPSALVLAGLSIALAPPESYVALLTSRTVEALNPSPHMMVNSQALAINLGLDFPAVKAVLAIGVLAAFLAIPRTADWDRWFWGSICAGLLISPHTFEYDAALLLIPILKILADAGAAPLRRAIAATVAIPLPYFMTLLPGPFAGVPGLLVFALFLAISWPAWFESRISPIPASPNPAKADPEFRR